MTLLLTVVTADGIVMGADSALTWRENGTISVFANFPKIVQVPRLNLGISMAGDAQIGPAGQAVWISDWVRQFSLDVSQSSTVFGFADELAEALNDTVGKDDQRYLFHIAGWIHGTAGGIPVKGLEGIESIDAVPVFVEVSNPGGGYKQVGRMKFPVMMRILNRRAGKDASHLAAHVFSAGFPQRYGDWIVRVGMAEHTKLIGAQVPHGDIVAVAEYVRFLIRSVSDLYKIARQPGIVSEPVETLLLLPNRVNMVSIRH